MAPVSYSRRVSPMHTSAIRPWANAALTLRATVSSVSLKNVRRSLWPSSTIEAPQSFTMSGETSPVHAPLSSQCMFWAPIFTRVPFSMSATSAMYGNGGMTKGCAEVICETCELRSALAKACASVRTLFIFQLVPIHGILRFKGRLRQNSVAAMIARHRLCPVLEGASATIHQRPCCHVATGHSIVSRQ